MLPMPFLIQQDTQRAADQLIDRQALLIEAQHLGLKSTPQEVKDELQHGRYSQIFFPEGNFVEARLSVRHVAARESPAPAMFEGQRWQRNSD